MALEELHLEVEPRLERVVAPLPAHLFGEAVAGLELNDLPRDEGALVVVAIDLDHPGRDVPATELRELLGGDRRRGPLVDGSLDVDEELLAVPGAVFGGNFLYFGHELSFYQA